MHEGIVRLRRVAQDGTKVRASAGAGSFGRKGSPKECLRQAREPVRKAKAELNREGGSATQRMEIARLRVAEDRRNRVKKALRHVDELRRSKSDEEQKEATRASTTDPERRVRKMAEGGFRPAYDLPFATDVEGRAIVGVQVTNQGNDQGQMEPMLADIGRRTERLPKEHLVDGGYMKLDSIEKAAAHKVVVFAPIQDPRRKDIDATKAKQNDGPGLAAWRKQMGTERAKQIHKARAATAERPNADLKNGRGLDSLPARWIGKVMCVVLWSTITFNLRRWMECAT